MKYLLPVLILLIFMHASCIGNAGDGVERMRMKDHGRVGCSSTAIRENLDSFWERTLSELAKIPIDAKIEKVNEALPYRKYFITARSLNNIIITAFLSIPVQGEAPAKPWPVIVTTCGYSGRGQGIMLSECMRGYAILQVFPRGQGESEKYFKLQGDKISSNLEKPDGHYYRGGYADIIRMIDYIITRPDIDSNRIAMAATSQGGGIALAVSALDKRIKTVVAHVPFLCNFRLAATIPNSLVKKLLDRANANNEISLQTLDYFDPLQLAPRIKVPVLMSAGGKDETCPLPTIRSVFDRLPGEKSLKIYPDLIHTTCLDFYELTWLWLDRNLKSNNRL